MKEPQDRLEKRMRTVVRCSIWGIVANLFLTLFKGAAGIFAGSIAVVLDALNSLTDAFSSIATIVGEKIAVRRPTQKHPYGYGRIEYVTSIVISAVIMAAGVISLREAILKIISPTQPDYSPLTLVILIVSILVKVVLAEVFIRKGRQISSQPLVASGIDARYDAILTGGTLACALICMIWGIDLDGWVGAIISLFVVKAGIDVLRDAVNSIIGERPEKERVNEIRSVISEHDGVRGVFDLMIDSFGPERTWAACRIEVSSDMLASEIHELTRHIADDLEEQCNTNAVIGIYAANANGEFSAMRDKLDELVEHHPEILQVHGFYVDKETRDVDFDLVIDFDHDPEDIIEHIVSEMKEAYPNFTYSVVCDRDYA